MSKRRHLLRKKSYTTSTRSYSPDDRVVIVDFNERKFTPEQRNPSNSTTTECLADDTFKDLSRTNRILTIIDRMVRVQEEKMIPSYSEIVEESQKRYKFFPSRQEIVEAKAIYKDKYPEIPDPFEEKKSQKNDKYKQEQTFISSQGSGKEYKNRLFFECSAFRVSVESNIENELVQLIVSSIKALGDSYDG